MKALIIEDEALIALDIKKTLINLNYDVVDMLSNDMEVFEFLHNNPMPDIFIMDINLGENSLNGMQIIEKIKTKYPDIKVIYLSGYSDNTTAQSILASDPLGYIVKPFKREKLEKILKGV